MALEGYSSDRVFADEPGIEAGRVALTQIRAAAAEGLGWLEDTRPAVIEVLEALVRAPAAHFPFKVATSLDGVAAVRSLARLNATGSVPVLTALLESDGADLRAANPQLTGRAAAMLAYHDHQVREQAARSIARLSDEDGLLPLVSRFQAERGPIAPPDMGQLLVAVPYLAARSDAAGRRACSEALFSPMGIVRREAFFRLLGADDRALTAQVVAAALSSRLADTQGLAGCATALHLLGLLGQRSPEVAAAVAAGEAAAAEAVRERALWCREALYRSS
jgi:hypothetical protein